MPSYVLFYGSPSNEAFARLAGHLLERGRARPVLLTPQRWTQDVELSFGAGADRTDGRLRVGNEDPIEFEDVAGVCIDGLYVTVEGLSDLSERDVEYAQVELWATLIALLGRLARTARVANVIAPRELLDSRMVMMRHLADHGVPVPRMRVTSDPAAARAFIKELGGKVCSRTVGSYYSTPEPLNAYDTGRLETVRFAPVHFEETSTGVAAMVSVVGDETFAGAFAPPRRAAASRRARKRLTATAFSAAVPVPETLRLTLHSVSRVMGAEMVDFALEHNHGRWRVTELYTHLTPASLNDGRILDAAARLLENGPRSASS